LAKKDKKSGMLGRFFGKKSRDESANKSGNAAAGGSQGAI